MERKIYSKLVNWKNQNVHKPLILNGVRQCGKTYILKEFGKREFETLAYVSCDRNDNLKAIYAGDFDVHRIIQGLSALTGVDIIPGKTLIFLDEIEAFPQALEALKYFCEDAPENVLIGDNVFTEYKGAFTEQYVLQQLLALGVDNIYYYSSDTSRMEIDFLIQRDGALLPIEVKGGTSTKATSLHHYLMEHSDISAIRYSMLPYRKQDNITNKPLYGVFL